MSSTVQTLKEVSRLLGALPGVAVLGCRIDGHKAIFEITCRGATSAHHVQRICEAANVTLEPSARLLDPELGTETTGSFSLSADTERFDLVEFGYLQLLGIHLVWHLHRTGAMPEEVANQLLRQWEGARVGA